MSSAKQGISVNQKNSQLTFFCMLLALSIVLFTTAPGFAAPTIHEGVASCSGSECHARQASTGLVVRQNEIITWQSPSSAAGSHSRAWQVLNGRRASQIAQKLGLESAARAPQCLGCHTDPVAAAQRGARFQISDGVGCEACHGGSGQWLSSHRAVGASHSNNVARGMIALDQPKQRASVCLGCHMGSQAPGQFASHKIMAAGHPRLSFELDLFTDLQRHHDVDSDYAARKYVAGGVKTWAVGQSMLVSRALGLYLSSTKTRGGSFPELSFMDCHACHRPISDDPSLSPRAVENSVRGTAIDTPSFNDQNMIMLSAAIRSAAPEYSNRFEAQSRALHIAIASDQKSIVPAAERLLATTEAVTDALAGHVFGDKQALGIILDITDGAQSGRFTDYAGAAQAVMAIDTLLNAEAVKGRIDAQSLKALRTQTDRAYQAVRDSQAFRPAEFRQALAQVAQGVRKLL